MLLVQLALVYILGYGQQSAMSYCVAVGRSPKETHMILNSVPDLKAAVTDGLQGIYSNLLGVASFAYVESKALKVTLIKQEIEVGQAFDHREHSRNEFGTDERGVRALSTGGPYCGLIDHHNAFKDHDLILAIRKWISMAPAGKGEDELIKGASYSYLKNRNYYKISGLPLNVVKRVITNVTCPAGVGLYIETQYSYISEDSTIICSAVPLDCKRELRIKAVESPDFTDHQWMHKMQDVYKEELKHYDFLGNVLSSVGHIS